MNKKRLAELAGLMLAENYEDSADFTGELDSVQEAVKKLQTKLKHPRWMKYLKDTDKNFGTQCAVEGKDVLDKLEELSNAFDQLVEELGRAE